METPSTFATNIGLAIAIMTLVCLGIVAIQLRALLDLLREIRSALPTRPEVPPLPRAEVQSPEQACEAAADLERALRKKDSEIQALRDSMEELRKKKERELQTLKASLGALVEEKQKTRVLRGTLDQLEQEKDEEFLALMGSIESLAREKEEHQKLKSELELMLKEKYQELEGLKRNIDSLQQDKMLSEQELIAAMAEKERQIEELKTGLNPKDFNDI